MRRYDKINVISDIHGYYEGLYQASLKACKSEPLFVLGDLFDHHYGDECKIIDLLLELASRESLILISGNHDLVINLAFNQILDDRETMIQLTKEKNIKKFNIFKYIFSNDFFEQYIHIKNKLLDTEVEESLKIEAYYNNINKLVTEKQYNAQYQKLQKLLSLFISYAEVEVNGIKLLLSHSGNPNDQSSRDTAKAHYQLNTKYDYGIMGHLTIPFVERMIEEEGDMIDFKQNFIMNQKLEGLNIEGTYMYNSHSKMIMIDNGSDRQEGITIY